MRGIEDRHPDVHVVVNPETRRVKARKIAALIQQERPLADATVLDVGTGAGTIAAMLSSVVGNGEVHSVDVVDVRVETSGYAFHRVDGPMLPFPDQTFDVVISNHCIEHIGGRAEQERSLAELARVLKVDGVGYLAVPNRWGPVEPHFRLAGLSWLPTNSLQSRYVRLAGRGESYDCRLLSRSEIHSMFSSVGLEARERTVAAMKVMGEVEEPSRLLNVILKSPPVLQRAWLPVVPTLVFTFERTA
jgi:SAM-dependent methyltransferase